jgi:hypothetical protein
MNRRSILAAILASAALVLAPAGTAQAHDPVPTADDVCGFEGQQMSADHDDTACGLDEKNQTGEDGEKQSGQKGATEEGANNSMQSGDQGATQTGQKGETQSGQQGKQQEGENEGDN